MIEQLLQQFAGQLAGGQNPTAPSKYTAVLNIADNLFVLLKTTQQELDQARAENKAKDKKHEQEITQARERITRLEEENMALTNKQETKDNDTTGDLSGEVRQD